MLISSRVVCETCSHFFSDATAPPAIYTLSLQDALPIFAGEREVLVNVLGTATQEVEDGELLAVPVEGIDVLVTNKEVDGKDRKSTRLNSSHRCISYAVFCLKKKTKKTRPAEIN